MFKKKTNKILIGSNNKGKIKEIRDLIPKKYRIFTPSQFKLKSPAENGKSFKENSLIKKIYKSKTIQERHRHRYEVNISYKDRFEKNGLIFSGLSPDNRLPEIIELKKHPWFIGVQFHPEFKSRPFNPHPLFSSFIKAAKKRYAK